jgi:hypothetical protein
MLEPAQVDDLVYKTASGVLKPPAGVERVVSQPMADQWGAKALHITIVLKPGSFDTLSGEQAIDNLMAINKALQAANDDRFAHISDTTEEEEAVALPDDPDAPPLTPGDEIMVVAEQVHDEIMMLPMPWAREALDFVLTLRASIPTTGAT